MNISIEILLMVTTSLTALIAVYVAYQQYRTNRERENREARAKRLLVYKKVKRFLAEVDATRRIRPNEYEMLKDAIAEADFLFPEKINYWLEDIESYAGEWFDQSKWIGQHIEMQSCSITAAEDFIANNPDIFKSATDLKNQCIDDLQDAHCELKSRFHPYLGQKTRCRILKKRRRNKGNKS